MAALGAVAVAKDALRPSRSSLRAVSTTSRFGTETTTLTVSRPRGGSVVTWWLKTFAKALSSSVDITQTPAPSDSTTAVVMRVARNRQRAIGRTRARAFKTTSAAAEAAGPDAG